MKKAFKQNNGITLIALVITIIVMLILVAVTVNMTVNGGLFGYAGNAARETEEKKIEESNIGNEFIIGGKTYKGIDDYLNSLNSEDKEIILAKEDKADASIGYVLRANGLMTEIVNVTPTNGEWVEIKEDNFQENRIADNISKILNYSICLTKNNVLYNVKTNEIVNNNVKKINRNIKEFIVYETNGDELYICQTRGNDAYNINIPKAAKEIITWGDEPILYIDNNNSLKSIRDNNTNIENVSFFPLQDQYDRGVFGKDLLFSYNGGHYEIFIDKNGNAYSVSSDKIVKPILDIDNNEHIKIEKISEIRYEQGSCYNCFALSPEGIPYYIAGYKAGSVRKFKYH